MIKVLVNGYKGKMGALATEYLRELSDITVCGTSTSSDDLAEKIQEHTPDVVLELTTASVAFDNAMLIMSGGARPVIGSSGLRDDDISRLKALAKARGVSGAYIPNFSIGAVLMQRLSEAANKYMKNVDIIEWHNKSKIDFPSGTAVHSASKLLSEGAFGHSSATIVNNIPIHSVRLFGVVARQDIIFSEPHEQLTISHISLDRACFMEGVALSIRSVVDSSEFSVGLDSFMTI
ncbi:4-hydroxy-tetrahydrodipicolinate reductase [Pseudomonas sp.]|uniref:4-hydroxy-tetrahydrodipicolinate reductase n=1 Tax=Pseudomonas sp. TaxID=306 RepID=UPI003C7861CF